MNWVNADQSVFDEHKTKAPAPLMQALDNVRGNKFAKDQDAPHRQTAPFRALSWSDLAVRLSVKPPEQDTPEQDAAAHSDSAAENPPAEGAAQEVAPAPQHEGGASATLSDLPASDDAPPNPVPDPQPVEPQAPAMDQAALQKMLDDAYAEGLSAGKAMTESEREAELSAQFERLDRIMSRLEAPDLLDIGALAASINTAVLELASQRVGCVLDDMPEPLIRNIDRLLENLAHLSGQRELFLSPEDLGLIGACFSNRQAAPLVQLHGDPALLRGDVRLRIGGAEMTDVLADLHEGAGIGAEVAV